MCAWTFQTASQRPLENFKNHWVVLQTKNVDIFKRTGAPSSHNPLNWRPIPQYRGTNIGTQHHSLSTGVYCVWSPTASGSHDLEWRVVDTAERNLGNKFFWLPHSSLHVNNSLRSLWSRTAEPNMFVST